MLFCIPCLCSPKRSLRVRPVCPMYCEGRVVSVFKTSFAINHVNQVIRGTREILMDGSSLSSIMKSVGGCVVSYEFTRFALTIVTASYFWWRRR